VKRSEKDSKGALRSAARYAKALDAVSQAQIARYLEEASHEARLIARQGENAPFYLDSRGVIR
jgi:hypothetical protein